MKIIAKEIEMISVFKKDGKIEPIKFKISDNDGEEQLIRVSKITSVTETKMAGITSVIFLCESVINEINKQYELKYRIGEHRWELYKY